MSEWKQDRETCERVAMKRYDLYNGEEYRSSVVEDPTGDWVDADEALDRIAALEAERDAAFKRGWEDAVKAVEGAVGRMRGINHGHGEEMSHAEILAAIAAIEPRKEKS